MKMKKSFGFVLLILLAGFLFADEPFKLDPWPAPLSNNAVTSVKSRGTLLLFSLMGIGPKKTWDATSTSAYSMDPDMGTWTEVHSVPGTAGRLAATAVGAREHVFLFGGYVVDGQGGENTLADVNVYEPLTDDGALALGGKYGTPVVAHGVVIVGTDRIQAFGPP